MSYKYNHSIQFDLDHLSQYEDVVELEKKKRELDHVYAQAAKADEYEAKAKAFDLIVAEDKSNFSCGDFCDDVRNIINSYESGGYDA